MNDINFASWMIAHDDPAQTRERAHRIALANAHRATRVGIRERIAAAAVSLGFNRGERSPVADCCAA